MSCQGFGEPCVCGDAENDLGVNDIFIPNDDPIIRPPKIRANTSLAYFTFIPSYNCTVRRLTFRV